MFGNITANFNDINEAEKSRYQELYCGLCHSIKERYGQVSRMGLSFDLTFFVLLLNSLYEPEEKSSSARCVAHPLESKKHSQSEYSDYAADLSVIFTYYKTLDDWHDDKKISARSYNQLLKGAFKKACEKRPLQAQAIKDALQEISVLEDSKVTSLDAAASVFGSLMGELFAYKNDTWAQGLKQFGMHLGRFIYLVDAAIDFEDDSKSGSYNPFVLNDTDPETIEMMLMTLMGMATSVFEKLPLVQDIHLLRSVLYSGVWQQYNASASTDEPSSSFAAPSMQTHYAKGASV